MTKGVDINAHKGGVRSEALSPIGVRATNYSSRPYQPSHCTALNKKGTACKARTVKGTVLCIGHLRQEVSQSG